MSSTFRFVWDGNVLLHETFNKDSSEHTELTTWVFEGFVPTAKLVNGKAYSIISDHLGTPILAVDSDGMEVWNRQLDIYGRVRKEYKHSSLGEDVFPFVPFLYQGQYYDFETNLAYNRYRYYSPESGMYISQDPIRLNGNNPNLYAYVGDSNMWVDRFGLDCQESREIAKKLSEPDVEEKLKKIYPAEEYEILREPRIYLNDENGNITKYFCKPDFMIINKQTKEVVELVDAKNRSGDFTDRQKQLNANGGEFRGSSRSNVIKKNSKLDIDHQIKIYRTSFTEEDLKNIKE